MTCRHCDRPARPRTIPATDHPGTVAIQGRGLCTHCWRNHRDDYDPKRRTHAELIEELDALGRVSEEEAADRLGVCLATLARAGRSQRRLDIARRFQNAEWRARRTA